MRSRALSGGHSTVGQVTTFDLKHLTWNAEKRQISVSLQGSVMMTAARVAEPLLPLKALAVYMFPPLPQVFSQRKVKPLCKLDVKRDSFF